MGSRIYLALDRYKAWAPLGYFGREFVRVKHWSGAWFWLAIGPCGSCKRDLRAALDAEAPKRAVRAPPATATPLPEVSHAAKIVVPSPVIRRPCGCGQRRTEGATRQ